MANISAIKLPDNTTYNIKAGAIPYGEVDSTSTSTTYTATVPGINELKNGTIMLLRNGVVTSASGFKININGLGAKPVYNNLTTGNTHTPTNPTRDTTIFNINYTMLFIYDEELVSGGAWICYRGYDSNSNTIGYQLRGNNSTRPAADKGYRYRIWLSSLDNQSWVPINTSTATNATTARSLNSRVIDPFGEIVYYSANDTTDAGERLTATTIWQQYALTIGYSYVKSLTAWDPVYLKCEPQTGGGAVMKDIVQALPSTADGFIYIYLGIAYSTTAMELRFYHPVYYHDGTGIRAWTGTKIPTKTSDLTNDSGFIEGVQVNGTDLTVSNNKVNVTKDAVVGNALKLTRPNDETLWDIDSWRVTSEDIDSDTSYVRMVMELKKGDVSANYRFYTAETIDTYNAMIGQALNGKVDKVTGKGLSTNDYTTDEKNKLAGIAAGAEANVNADWNATTGDAQILNKPTTISGYGITDAYTKAQVDGLVASVLHYKGTKASVANLPTSDNTIGDVWHITADGSEYAWDGSAWQELGTAIDLSEYATKATTLAGYGISDAKIENGTITLGSNSITPLTSFTETDPVFLASPAHDITANDIANWNAGEANVQSDWGQTDSTADDFVKNKPTLFSGDYGDLTSRPIYFGTCPTADTETVKIVTLNDADDFSLDAGVRIAVQFTRGHNGNSSRPQLNVNNTGAVNVCFGDSTQIPSDERLSLCGWNRETVLFEYSGSNWVMLTSSFAVIQLYNRDMQRANWDETDASSLSYIVNKPDVPVRVYGTTATETPTEVKEALSDGNIVEIVHEDQTFGFLTFFSFNYSWAFKMLISNTLVDYQGSTYLYTLIGNTNNDSWSGSATPMAKLSDIPTIPTNVSSFANDAGYITSYTDEKLKVTANTTSGTFYPILTGATTTAENKKYDTLFTCVRASGTDAIIGIGINGTAKGSLRLYTTTASRYGIITPGTLTDTRTYTLPDQTGTIALTADIPTVPAWAQASTKPTYTASEVGALPDTITIPEATTAINDSGYIYNGQTVDSKISGVGLATSTNLLTSTSDTYALLRGSSTNPLLGLKCGNNLWYAQAMDNYFYFGPTSTKAMRLDQNGNALFVGTVQANGDLTLYTPSGNSPGIIFQRGTLTDNYNDWKIYDKSGYLYFAQRGSGSAAFGDIGYIDTGGVLRGFTIPWGNVSGKPTFATVATSGSYNDLSDKPTIPDGLPSVTTADNGKVLRVANGAWSAVALPSASGVSF